MAIIKLKSLALWKRADEERENLEAVMPGYTHLQRAQPATFAHYMMAYANMMRARRDPPAGLLTSAWMTCRSDPARWLPPLIRSTVISYASSLDLPA